SERSLGLARLGRLARAANREDDRLGAGLCLLVAGEACLDQNLPRSARSLLDEARRYFDPSREPELVQLAALKKAWAHLDLGEFGTAAERARELARLETFPRSWRWSLCWLLADLFYHLKGPWPEIRYWLNRAHEELKGRFLKAPLDRLEEQIRAFELLADSAARPAAPLRPDNALRVAQEAARLLRRRFELPLGEEFKFSLWEDS
ncbi:MAG TPA: hypothetical protein PK413_17220, partial [Thermoanaerobaculia bacterium]|nr:hypothetical protein [Thermoanaerobaculia bacterium]